jgi:hypothetical protein
MDEYRKRNIDMKEGEWIKKGSKEGEEIKMSIGFRGSIPGGGWEFIPSPPRLDRLWGPLSLLSNGYRSLFPWG